MVFEIVVDAPGLDPWMLEQELRYQLRACLDPNMNPVWPKNLEISFEISLKSQDN